MSWFGGLTGQPDTDYETEEEAAIRRAKGAYTQGRIDATGLEAAIERILNGTDRRYYVPHTGQRTDY